MTYKKKDGTVLSKAAIIAGATDVTPASVQQFQIGFDVYQDFKTDPKDGGGFESETRKVFHQGQVVSATELTAHFDAATVTGISPASGSHTATQNVTITGTNLAGTTGVTFGGNAATNVKVVDEQTVTCTAPVAGSAGAVTVVVADDSGSVTKTNFYTYS